MAKRLGTGPLQVIFRFARQIGILPLTGTANEQHMKEDLKVEQVELSQDEVKVVEGIAV
jgi:diketogulonate reductase-like aldo/keto reductase